MGKGQEWCVHCGGFIGPDESFAGAGDGSGTGRDGDFAHLGCHKMAAELAAERETHAATRSALETMSETATGLQSAYDEKKEELAETRAERDALIQSCKTGDEVIAEAQAKLKAVQAELDQMGAGSSSMVGYWRGRCHISEESLRQERERADALVTASLCKCVCHRMPGMMHMTECCWYGTRIPATASADLRLAIEAIQRARAAEKP